MKMTMLQFQLIGLSASFFKNGSCMLYFVTTSIVYTCNLPIVLIIINYFFGNLLQLYHIKFYDSKITYHIHEATSILKILNKIMEFFKKIDYIEGTF